MTLVEMLVVLAVLSILAVLSLPFAEMTIRRGKELELRRSLREIRNAIDRVHADWELDRISRLSRRLSENGYPKTLSVLVEGIKTGDAAGTRRKYLRRIPRDPFVDPAITPDEQWALLSYRDASDATVWGGEDVYDVHSNNQRTAINGSKYQDW